MVPQSGGTESHSPNGAIVPVYACRIWAAMKPWFLGCTGAVAQWYVAAISHPRATIQRYDKVRCMWRKWVTVGPHI